MPKAHNYKQDKLKLPNQLKKPLFNLMILRASILLTLTGNNWLL